MPELPDICVYIDAIESRIADKPLQRIQVLSPFFLRTAEPPVSDVEGQRVTTLRRLGKRVAIGFENDLWLVIHLMIAGRFQWRDGPPAPRKPNRNTLAVLNFEHGALILTEAGSKKRASLHVVD
ncbi:MAG: DNA-formamidopyrimidine glycosylase family protein, partial [Pseudomonadota bacterium]